MLTKLGHPREALRKRRQDRGFTLIEMLVGITLLGIIMLPLSMAIIGILRNTIWADEALDRNNDAQRIAKAWTGDVQNVEPGGVNPLGTECRPVQEGTAPETALVSFRWQVPSGPGANEEKVASWTAVGSGRDLSLWRRECTNGTVVNAQKLAAQIGAPGKQGIDVVHGPAKKPENPSPHTARSFCPFVDTGSNGFVGKSCTIVIDGSWKYELEVSRRVVDTLEATEFLQAPAAPRNLTATPRNRSIVARFETPIMQAGQPPVDQYRVRAVPASGGSAVEVIVAAGSNPVLGTVDGLSNSVDYVISVQAHNAVGWGDWTEEIGPFRPMATEPNAPVITSVVPGDKEVTVSWTAPDNDGGSPILRWHFYGQDSSSNWLNHTGGFVSPMVVNQPGGAAPAASVDAGVYSAVFPGLVNGTSYHFYVAGVNAITSGSSSPNPPLTVQPGEGLLSVESAGVTPYGPPESPEAVEAQAGNPVTTGGEATAQVTVRWSPPADTNGGEIISYRVLTYKGLNASAPLSTTGELVTPATAGCPTSQATDVCEITRNIAVSAAAPADYYRFSVATRSEAPSGDQVESDESDRSGPFGSQRGTAQPPHVKISRAPDQVTGSITLSKVTGGINVSFPAPYNGGEPIERVRFLYRARSTAPGSTFPTSWSQSEATATVSGSTVSGVLPYTTGSREVQVTVAVGNRGEWVLANNFRYGIDSANSSSIVVPGAPGPASGVAVQRPSGSFGQELAVQWTAATDNGGASISYTVRCTDTSGVVVTSPGHVGTSATVTGLRDGRNSTCRVFTVNTHGESTGVAGPAREPFGECIMNPDIDSFVNESSKNAIYGNSANVEANAHGGQERQTLLRFPLNGGSGVCINHPTRAMASTAQFRNGATLRMYRHDYDRDCGFLGTSCILSSYMNSRLYKVNAPGTWAENGLTWNNRPGVDWGSGGHASNVVELTTSNGFYTWNVNNGLLDTIKADGTRTLLVARENGDNYRAMRNQYFDSRLHSDASRRPTLTFTFNTSAP